MKADKRDAQRTRSVTQTDIVAHLVSCAKLFCLASRLKWGWVIMSVCVQQSWGTCCIYLGSRRQASNCLTAEDDTMHYHSFQLQSKFVCVCACACVGWRDAGVQCHKGECCSWLFVALTVKGLCGCVWELLLNQIQQNRKKTQKMQNKTWSNDLC